MSDRQQETFFDSPLMPEEFWCWTVEWRFLPPEKDGEGGKWHLVMRPNHFRQERNAVSRGEALMEEFKAAARLKMLEIRVVPKYIGYVPPADETWIV